MRSSEVIYIRCHPLRGQTKEKETAVGNRNRAERMVKNNGKEDNLFSY